MRTAPLSDFQSAIFFGKKFRFGKDFNLVLISVETFFFSGIWGSFREYCSDAYKNFFLCVWGYETLFGKKILIFWTYLGDLWLVENKNFAFFAISVETGFFLEVQFWGNFWSFFEVMHCRMAKNGPKLMKIYFSRL